MWPKRTGSGGETHEMTTDEKLDLLGESVKLLAISVLKASRSAPHQAAERKLAELEQLWSDAE